VLVILGVLVALAVPRFTASATKAKETTFCSNVRTIKSQLELYKMTTGSYPITATTAENPNGYTFSQFLNDPNYFESAPINPYTEQAFKENDGGASGQGQFTYTSTDGTTYTITSTPACDIVQ